MPDLHCARIVLLAAPLLCAGCASALWSSGANPHEMEVVELSEAEMHKGTPQSVAKPADSAPAPTSTPSAGEGSKSPPPGFSAPPANSPQSAPQTLPDSRALAALLTELQAAGALDAAAQQELVSDLKQSDPALWPQLVRQFRLAMSYRRRAAGPQPTTINAESDPLAAAVQQSLQSPEPKSPPAPADPPQPTRSAAIDREVKPTTAIEPAETTPQSPMANSPSSSLPRTSASSAVKSPPLSPAKATSGLPLAPAANAGRLALSPPPVKRAQAPAAADTDQWQTRLTESILTLESQSSLGQSSPADIDRQVRLRFLYLVAGRRDDALRPIAGLPADQQDFWTKQLYGLATYLDVQRTADPERRATEAALHLQQAASQLGELASPVVRNLAFCKEVTSFGVFKRFASYEFKPGEEVLLYCEVEHLKSQSTEQGYHTTVKSSYQILDSRGQRVAEQEFPASDDFCANPRRDFFIPYFIALPKRLNSGTYTLQLTIEDGLSNKVGQSSIQFSVK